MACLPKIYIWCEMEKSWWKFSALYQFALFSNQFGKYNFDLKGKKLVKIVDSVSICPFLKLLDGSFPIIAASLIFDWNLHLKEKKFKDIFVKIYQTQNYQLSQHWFLEIHLNKVCKVLSHSFSHFIQPSLKACVRLCLHKSLSCESSQIPRHKSLLRNIFLLQYFHTVHIGWDFHQTYLQHLFISSNV